MQVVVCRRSEPRCVIHDEFDLLRETAADDGVVLLEAHRPRFAAEQFLFQVPRDQGVQLLARRLALLQTLPRFREESDLRGGDAHRAGAIVPTAGFAAMEPRVHAKQQRAEHKKVNERLVEPSFHGLYQMGEVYARR